MSNLTKNAAKCNLKPETVLSNPFFICLKQTYNELYLQVANNGWRICVPHSSSINGVTINEYFIKSHIFQSSPYFKEEYVTLNGQYVTCRDGVISTKSGFDNSRKVYILSEELCYNDEFKSFVVYCISGSLLGGATFNNDGNNELNDSNCKLAVVSKNNTTNADRNRHGSNDNNENNKNFEKALHASIEDRTYEDWQLMLKTWLDSNTYQLIMNEIKTFAELFNRSFVMIKGHTNATSKRIELLRNKIIETLINNNSQFENDPKNKNKLSTKGSISKMQKLDDNKIEEIKSLLDCYIHYILYDRIFNKFLISHYKEEDESFYNKLISLQSLTQDEIGIKSQFQCNFQLAINELSCVDEFHCPLQKLSCLKRSAALIREAVEQIEQNHKSLNNKIPKILDVHDDNDNNDNNNHINEDRALTTDDMLSFFTYVLIHSQLKHVISTLEYLKHFHLSLSSTIHLEYLLATFQGCIQYIEEHLISPKTTKTPKTTIKSTQSTSSFSFQNNNSLKNVDNYESNNKNGNNNNYNNNDTNDDNILMKNDTNETIENDAIKKSKSKLKLFDDSDIFKDDQFDNEKDDIFADKPNSANKSNNSNKNLIDDSNTNDNDIKKEDINKNNNLNDKNKNKQNDSNTKTSQTSPTSNLSNVYLPKKSKKPAINTNSIDEENLSDLIKGFQNLRFNSQRMSGQW